MIAVKDTINKETMTCLAMEGERVRNIEEEAKTEERKNEHKIGWISRY